MPNLLDVDPSIMERNLIFQNLQKIDGEDPADSLFNIKPKEPDGIPWKPVKPNPGYCVKLRTQEGDKIFVNVCHTDAMPEPEEICEEKLLQMIMDDDVPSFRIPISIGDLHIESDKAHNPCSVYDIAVNSKFFKKMNSSEVFNTFFMNVSIQALQEKYSLDLDLKSEKPFLLLKNRKVLGSLQVHRIQQREVKKAPGQLIQEISSKPAEKKTLIEVIEGKPLDADKDKLQIKPLEKTEAENKKIDKNLIQPRSSVSDRQQNGIGLKQIHENTSNTKGSMKCLEEVNTLSSITLNNNENIVSPPSDDSEKGMKESQVTKDNLCEELEERKYSNEDERLKNIIASESDKRGHVEQDDGPGNCSGLFCLKQYPEKGFPQILIASIRLNVKSSRDFGLELDRNRLHITTKGSEKPWFGVYLPYNIDVNKVEACFVTESQKLMIKMDVIGS